MFLRILEILGWMLLGQVVLILTFYVLISWDGWMKDLKNFFYGLWTWQERKPVYRDIGNNQFENLFAWLSPVDHWEWVKRKTPKFIRKIKIWYNKTFQKKHSKI